MLVGKNLPSVYYYITLMQKYKNPMLIKLKNKDLLHLNREGVLVVSIPSCIVSSSNLTWGMFLLSLNFDKIVKDLLHVSINFLLYAK